jgi:four helix bundle protein
MKSEQWKIKNMNDNPLKDKSYAFAIHIVKWSQYLLRDKKEFVLSKQVLRSGTAISAPIREAEFGQSKARLYVWRWQYWRT